MKILVTGGAGFIGSHVVDAYIEHGYEVVVIDNLSNGKVEHINKKSKFMNIDIIKDKRWLETIFQEEKFDLVNHHAAQKSVVSSMQNPTFDAHSNIIASLYLLENATRYGVKKFIFISSGGALSNDQNQIPSPEHIQPKFESPYAISKYTIEKYLEFYHTNFGLTYTILRYANVYGPRQTPDGESGVVPIFLRNLLAGKPSVIYTFPDMPRGATRDYVYITDVVEANMLALYKGDNQILNIGTGISLWG